MRDIKYAAWKSAKAMNIFTQSTTSSVSACTLYFSNFTFSLTQPLTAVQPVYNPFSQFVSQAQLYSQLKLSLQSDPIALGIPTST